MRGIGSSMRWLRSARGAGVPTQHAQHTGHSQSQSKYLSTRMNPRVEFAPPKLKQLPCNQLFELPGRPNVLYTLKDYSGRGDEGPKEARAECGFLFKAFETGQIG
jgi:hypothetical protein